MNYDKLFDLILARRETRTTSTQYLAIIASSASLLLFIAYFENSNLDFNPLILILGILFPIIGIFYHEATYRHIGQSDNDVLNALALINVDDNKREKILKKYIQFTPMRSVRSFSLYLLLTFPILGWVFLIFAVDTMTVVSSVNGLFVDGIIIVAIIIHSLNSKIPEFKIPDFLKAEYNHEKDEES